MFRKCFILTLASFALTVAASLTASAQTGELRGHVILKQADGTSAPASEAVIDVYRTDLPGKYPTKTNKKGEFVFAGLPYVGTYLIAVSHPAAQPTWLTNVQAGRQIDYEVILSPGDGKRLTQDEVKRAAAQGGGAASGGKSSESTADKAKREELERKNQEIIESNKKIESVNATVGRTFKAGNEALGAKNYDEAIKQYDEGLAADPDQAALLTNKALALKARGVLRYNAAIVSTEGAAKTSGLEAAKGDFRAGADASRKAVELLKAQTAPADPGKLAEFNDNKAVTLSTHAETMRLFVSKVDQSQADAGQAAYEEYIAAETDPAKKAKATRELALLLLEAGAYDKAQAEYKKILVQDPNDTDALQKLGVILFAVGAIKESEGKKDEAKAEYQQAANYLQQFVDKAPEGQLKTEAKDTLENIKNQQNVKPEKTATPTRRRRP